MLLCLKLEAFKSQLSVSCPILQIETHQSLQTVESAEGRPGAMLTIFPGIFRVRMSNNSGEAPDQTLQCTTVHRFVHRSCSNVDSVPRAAHTTRSELLPINSRRGTSLFCLERASAGRRQPYRAGASAALGTRILLLSLLERRSEC